MWRVSMMLLSLVLRVGAQTSFEEVAKLFDNDDKSQPAREESTRIEGRGRAPGVRMFKYSFASPVAGAGSVVPGILVTPDRPGRFPLILFGHWMMDGSPMRNHTEFLEEAIVFAKAGTICLLVDSPLIRPGVSADPDPMGGQSAKATLQMAREWRRALDHLLARPDVDAGRVAYVGHSFNAGVGAKLVAVEKRIQSFVLMANTYSLRDFVYDDGNQEMVEFRKKVGEAAIQSYFEKFPWEDSKEFALRSAPSAVFLQNGRLDKPIPESIVRKSFAYFQETKRLEFYDAGHELNSRARADRARWLQQRLKLRGVDFRALESIPQLR